MGWDDLKIPFLISAIVVFLVSLYFYVIRNWKTNSKEVKYPHLFSLETRRVKGTIKLKYELPDAENVAITVLDQFEKPVFTVLNEYISEGVHEALLDSSFLQPGTYFLLMKTSNHKNMKRFEKI